MKYAIYIEFNDGYVDTYNVDSANIRDNNIRYYKTGVIKDIKSIMYSPIYTSGEYGKRIKVF